MKKGFTLIELVFTIVILAITTMAIPRIVAQTVNLNMFAVQQELVYNAKSMMSRIQPAKWDSAYSTSAGCTGGCSNANVIHSVNIAAGATKESRVGILDSEGKDKKDSISDVGPTPYGNFGIGVGSIRYAGKDKSISANQPYWDLDDYQGFKHKIKSSDLVTGDFVLNTETVVSVDYVADPLVVGNYNNSSTLVANFGTTPANGTPTNVKMVNVVTRNEDDPGASVALRYYGFNIGSGSMKIDKQQY
ncbi:MULTISPECIES: type II secretion system protein [unclassified Campylobacter]|uniref:type II secretion system protein n=1 Tax=unclassified Campylobacter TaxID=2593542 RepID=UPI0022E9EC7D|nr:MULTISPECIES: prepilin-type N-terminal cleavage/methylation domain-containing protein [unclassified Campylobacter]MDA3054261.1 prepilin-type N-terminal cleavage/methylation domain-containing protein [Campylobacter sp. VBCF_07 NA4]MDA3060952.1 prepilin-type N-terminal cleavage/methylation domain-containing protein [Campylobacter sp. VBCF_02 NA5]MDA3070465.1 prepilin-type N-terminal cleavage/methylation domain-containing protein [Campylobacter sp. VBCF_08 NA3]WBR53773.1 prepilin-type N-termina